MLLEEKLSTKEGSFVAFPRLLNQNEIERFFRYVKKNLRCSIISGIYRESFDEENTERAHSNSHPKVTEAKAIATITLRQWYKLNLYLCRNGQGIDYTHFDGLRISYDSEYESPAAAEARSEVISDAINKIKDYFKK